MFFERPFCSLEASIKYKREQRIVMEPFPEEKERV